MLAKYLINVNLYTAALHYNLNNYLNRITTASVMNIHTAILITLIRQIFISQLIHQLRFRSWKSRWWKVDTKCHYRCWTEWLRLYIIIFELIWYVGLPCLVTRQLSGQMGVNDWLVGCVEKLIEKRTYVCNVDIQTTIAMSWMKKNDSILSNTFPVHVII